MLRVYRLRNPYKATREAALVGTIKVWQAGTKGQAKQKVTTISQYRSSEMILVTLSTGHLAVVNFHRLTLMSILKAHKGNISSACFLQDYRYFATASGSFKGKTDNSV